ncbi:Bifunctional F420 biosynthesis protein FbiB [Bacteroides pyogenes]|uniref:Nitroreductase family protein n=2 Tax=Bacteroides pyogenes TaxID=310300 RepID=A0A5D3ERT8_9BACE|nr:nitroreductase family protein [Bacteroides pyogenes]MBR8705438.1 Bifunctional F420 biosynthesis protein FbiB [Bacteroides pyogenes]MBR8709373.1 Bifunctional F420 biosynthesis protein FbiB [Bacteroides pyogenes]MBR8718196.1 Bifunctional F420 biosynthesis protein FbiB [Bacteroides pyogenes]MBR8720537.1 Bifunctional F420 biosynthesis protein FbiB [Bacteroides pyogenes]MBR8725317.1 Bifunctional F420 biosynthesis protein FbiB [Bacteroides pyogenes]
MKTNEVLENIRTRRSIRAYTSQPVAEEDLQLILEAATYAPNGMHYETWHFTAIQDAEKLKELNRRIKGAFARSDDPRLQERGHNENYCCYYHAPALVIVSNEPVQWWASMDCACAIENMFLAAHSLGIGSCWINQPGSTCDDYEVRELLTALGVPTHHRVYGCVALGYADPLVPLKEKVVKAGCITMVR